MNSAITVALERLVASQDLEAEQSHAAFAALMDGHCTPAEIAALLTALRVKGEAVEEIEGAARAMRERSTKIPTRQTGLLDTCGTGGDMLSTFNISTATALVVAAAGVPVAKHGNRSVSSSSGSADVLEALGVNIQLTAEQVGRCVDELGIGFCFAPLLHGAMKFAAPVRKELGFRTIFNLLGPLTNPAGAAYQLVGVNRCDFAEKLATALSRLGIAKALVVCGNDQLDEVSLWGETTVFQVSTGRVDQAQWTAATFGLPECRVEQLRVTSAADSAAVLRRVFAGQSGAARDIVLANSAAALVAAERCDSPQTAVHVAAEALDSGRTAELCRRLQAFTAEFLVG